MQALLLPVGDDFYALPVSWVREVVASPGLTQLVTSPPWVMGLFNLRGQIVPLLDTAVLLGTGSIDEVAFAVVVDWEQGQTGLAVTGFPDRELLGTSTGPSELVGTVGLFQVGDRIAALLDPAALLQPDRPVGADTHAEHARVGAG